ncbi:hypothetical protein Hanom_Chr12g01112881 [Helianthus anomalus]
MSYPKSTTPWVFSKGTTHIFSNSTKRINITGDQETWIRFLSQSDFTDNFTVVPTVIPTSIIS